MKALHQGFLFTERLDHNASDLLLYAMLS